MTDASNSDLKIRDSETIDFLCSFQTSEIHLLNAHQLHISAIRNMCKYNDLMN